MKMRPNTPVMTTAVEDGWGLGLLKFIRCSRVDRAPLKPGFLRSVGTGDVTVGVVVLLVVVVVVVVFKDVLRSSGVVRSTIVVLVTASFAMGSSNAVSPLKLTTSTGVDNTSDCEAGMGLRTGTSALKSMFPLTKKTITPRATHVCTIEGKRSSFIGATIETLLAIQSIVVVTSPMTVQAPPALEAMTTILPKMRRSFLSSITMRIREHIPIVVV
mmetsp:Transcript_44546/g.72518  ORF Transcript_44546/g.72518 Transcript_44546/m.72518 type:complete len:215 (+) Transcript_44546:413-1057(+)